MKKALAIVLFCFAALYLQAQTDTVFQYTYGGTEDEVCNQVKVTRDGGYIMIGTTNSFGYGATDFYVVKTDSMCRHQWSKFYGSTQNDEGYSVEPTYDHGYAFLGWTDGFGNGYDALLVKTDSVGNVEWQKTYGGSDWDFGYSLRQTADSGFVICGQTYSYGAGNGDVYVVRTNKYGDTLWTRAIGGPGYDIGNSVYVKNDSLYVIAGATTSFGLGDTNMYFIEISNKGVVERDTAFGCKNGDMAYSIEPTTNGSYIVAGCTDSVTAGNRDGVLFKTDSLCKTVQWYSLLPYKYTDIGKDALLCPDGSYVFTGTSNSDGLGGYAMMIMHFGGWGGWIGGVFEGGTGDEQGNSCAYNTINNNVVFAGATNSNGYTTGLNDFYLVRYKNDTDIVSDNLCYHVLKQFHDTLSPSGISEQQQTPLMAKVFPDPVYDMATVIVQDATVKCTFSLYDVTGKCVINNIPMKPAGHKQIMAHFAKGNMQPGIYFYKIKSAGNKTATGKIMVE